VKRGMAGRTRRGAPPLRRQRGALRVVQLTLLALAGMLGALAASAFRNRGPAAMAEGLAPSSLLEAAVLLLLAVLSVAGALAIGVRTVRGPEPPSLE
jgi:hypothetical protein